MQTHRMVSDARIFAVMPNKMQGANDCEFKHSSHSSNFLLDWCQNRVAIGALVTQSSEMVDQKIHHGVINHVVVQHYLQHYAIE